MINFSKHIPANMTEEDKAVRKRRLKRIKDRSRAMETIVARKLGGKRVPMSGASSFFKGDGIFYIGGKLHIIECKTTENKLRTGDSRYYLGVMALKKLESDVRAMNAYGGVFVIHFLNSSNYYCFIKESELRQYTLIPDTTPTLTDRYRDIVPVYKMKMDASLQEHRYIRYVIGAESYICMYIETLKDLMERCCD